MANCVHKWLLEEQSGSQVVTGECRVCGETRVFGASNEAVDALIKLGKKSEKERLSITKEEGELLFIHDAGRKFNGRLKGE